MSKVGDTKWEDKLLDYMIGLKNVQVCGLSTTETVVHMLCCTLGKF